MTYTLAIGDRTYSSWSLRGWLMFAAFDLPVTVKTAQMKSDAFSDMLKDFGAARLVPAMRVDGAPVWDTLAIAETLAERHPDAGLWPRDAAARGLARSMVCEMHAGFSALRTDCPMNLRHAYDGFQPTDAVRADLERLEMLWSLPDADGPWIFGAYSLADVFFAPVATRIATYKLPVSDAAKAYVAAHLAYTPLRQWRAMGLAENYVQPGYDLDLPRTAWPGPAPVAADICTDGTAENEVCPYSGLPVASDSLARIDGHVIGFCNTFCRDKSVADAEAWPALTALRASLG